MTLDQIAAQVKRARAAGASKASAERKSPPKDKPVAKSKADARAAARKLTRAETAREHDVRNVAYYYEFGGQNSVRAESGGAPRLGKHS